MLIELKKFGDILTSREAGREAYTAFLPTLNSIGGNEEIKIDFQGVSVLTPSWADEFIRPIFEKYNKKVSLINDTNPSVQSALRFANPNLDLRKITVFEDKIVFDEISDDKIYNKNKTLLVIKFPYSDEETLRILANKKPKEINVYCVNGLSPSRLKAVIQMLNQAGIRTQLVTVNK